MRPALDARCHGRSACGLARGLAQSGMQVVEEECACTAIYGIAHCTFTAAGAVQRAGA